MPTNSGCVGKPGKKGFKVPATLGACADLLWQLKQERSEQQAKADAYDERITILTKHLIEKLPADDAEGVVGKLAKVVINRKTIPTVAPDGWDKVWQYVVKNKAFDLVQRRLNTKAVTDRWEANKAIPGIEKFQAKSVSVTKR